MQIATIDCCDHSARVINNNMVCICCGESYKLDNSPQETFYPNRLVFISDEPYLVYNIDGKTIAISSHFVFYGELLGGIKLNKSTGKFFEEILID